MVKRQWRKLHNEELSDLFLLTIHHHCYRHLANMQLCHLLNWSVLTHPEVSLVVSPVPSACWSVVFLSNILNLLHGELSVCCKNLFCITVFCQNKCILNFCNHYFFTSPNFWCVKNKNNVMGKACDMYRRQATRIRGFD